MVRPWALENIVVLWGLIEGYQRGNSKSRPLPARIFDLMNKITIKTAFFSTSVDKSLDISCADWG